MNAPAETTSSRSVELSGVDPERVIEEIFGDQPRAAYWRELREILASRLKLLRAQFAEMAQNDPERVAFEKRIEEMREQVQALATEEAITQFQEDTVRASLSRPARPDGARLADRAGLAGAFPFDFDEFEDYEE